MPEAGMRITDNIWLGIESDELMLVPYRLSTENNHVYTRENEEGRSTMRKSAMFALLKRGD